MKKCPKCGSQTIEEASKIFRCLDNGHILGVSELLALKKIVLEKRKQKQKKDYNEAIEQTQKAATKKPYMRCRYFEIEDL